MIRALKTTSDPPSAFVAVRRRGRSGLAGWLGCGSGCGPPGAWRRRIIGAGFATGPQPGAAVTQGRQLSRDPPDRAAGRDPPRGGPPPRLPTGPPVGRRSPRYATDPIRALATACKHPRRTLALSSASGGRVVKEDPGRVRRTNRDALAARGPPWRRTAEPERPCPGAWPSLGHFCRPDSRAHRAAASMRAWSCPQLRDISMLFSVQLIATAQNRVNDVFIGGRTARQFLP
jgi:hypothetical protein